MVFLQDLLTFLLSALYLAPSMVTVKAPFPAAVLARAGAVRADKAASTETEERCMMKGISFLVRKCCKRKRCLN